MNDYYRIERLIHFLDKNRHLQPNLETLAEHVDLSPFHLHRLFSEWAGITPKAFLKCLTIQHAKEQLKKGESVLSASLDSGLSGPGRLHDLCVTLESASPGEIKAGGQGWQIESGFIDSPFGTCLIALSPRGICNLSFVPNQDRKNAEALIANDWPNATILWSANQIKELESQIFRRPSAQPETRTIKALVKGSEFQVRVWRSLMTLPPGYLASYGSIAKLVGTPNASRAVGSAIGKNHLALLIPCHRVIRKTGMIGDYRWGSERKKAIIAWESSA